MMHGNYRPIQEIQLISEWRFERRSMRERAWLAMKGPMLTQHSCCDGSVDSGFDLRA